jgi:hypothetical protein
MSSPGYLSNMMRDEVNEFMGWYIRNVLRGVIAVHDRKWLEDSRSMPVRGLGIGFEGSSSVKNSLENGFSCRWGDAKHGVGTKTNGK